MQHADSLWAWQLFIKSFYAAKLDALLHITKGLDFGKSMLTFHLTKSNTFKVMPPSYFLIYINLCLHASALITIGKYFTQHINWNL